jgi:hypothetical protein
VRQLVLSAEPAFEVGRPFVVGRLGRDHPARRIERPTPPPGGLHEPAPLENVADRRGRRPVRRRLPRRQNRQKLARTQIRKASPKRDDPSLLRRSTGSSTKGAIFDIALAAIRRSPFAGVSARSEPCYRAAANFRAKPLKEGEWRPTLSKSGGR